MNAGGNCRVAAEQRGVQRPREDIEIVAIRIVNPDLEPIIVCFRREIAGEGKDLCSRKRQHWCAQFGPLIFGDETRLRRHSSFGPGERPVSRRVPERAAWAGGQLPAGRRENSLEILMAKRTERGSQLRYSVTP